MVATLELTADVFTLSFMVATLDLRCSTVPVGSDMKKWLYFFGQEFILY